MADPTKTTSGEVYVVGMTALAVTPDGTPTAPSLYRTEADPTVAPTPSLVADGTGNCTNGSHVFAFTCVTFSGETGPSPVSAPVTVDGSHNKVSIVFTAGSAFTFGGDAAAGGANSGGVNIYASKANTTSPLYLVATSPTVASNTGTTPTSPYVLNIADGSFTATTLPTVNTTKDVLFTATANGGLAIGGAKVNASGHATAVGVGANANYNTGSSGVAIGAGAYAGSVDVAVGTGAVAGGGTGVAVGGAASAAADSVAVGRSASAFASSVALGRVATTTAANQFVAGSTSLGTSYIDNAFFGNGVTAAAPQAFTLNGSGASGADTAGGDVSIAAGKGTGTGVSGSVRLKVAPHGLTSSTANALIDALVLGDTGVVTKFNNVATAGYGIPAIYASGRFTGQVAAKASVATYTPTADGSFEVSANVLVTTATTHTFTAQCTYTDEGNTARTVTLPFRLVGDTTALTSSIVNTNGAVPYLGVPVHIRVKASTAITILTQAAGTYTTVAYNVEGIIRQLA